MKASCPWHPRPGSASPQGAWAAADSPDTCTGRAQQGLQAPKRSRIWFRVNRTVIHKVIAWTNLLENRLVPQNTKFAGKSRSTRVLTRSIFWPKNLKTSNTVYHGVVCCCSQQNPFTWTMSTVLEKQGQQKQCRRQFLGITGTHKMNVRELLIIHFGCFYGSGKAEKNCV